MLRNRLIATTAALALAVGQVSPCFAGLGNPVYDTPAANDNSGHTSTTSFVSTAIANLQAYIVGLLGGKLSHVSNATALASLTVYSIPIMRDDVGVLYTDTGASCTISGGDSGWQIQPASGHCWQADISKGAPITLWPAGVANDSTDIYPALTAGASALNAVGGGVLTIPATPTPFRLSTSFVLTVPGVIVHGQNQSAKIDINFATGNALTVRSTKDSGFENLTFLHAVTRTSGADVEVEANMRNARVKDIDCSGGGIFFTCVGVDNNSAITELYDIYAVSEGTNGICVGCMANAVGADVIIRGGDFNYQHGAAINLLWASGVDIHDINADFNQHAIWIHPPANESVGSVVTYADDYFDVSAAESCLVDASAGRVSEVRFNAATWCASAGSAPSSFPVTTFATAFTQNATAPGLGVSGTVALLIDNSFDVLAFNNGGDGIKLSGGTDNRFSGTTAANGRNCSSGTCHGFEAAAGTTHWSWNGRAGGTTGIQTSVASGQGYGVFVNGGASDYYSISGDLSGNATGPFSDAGTGIHKTYDGMLPPPNWGTYTPVATPGSGSYATAPTCTGLQKQTNSTVQFTASCTTTSSGNGTASGSVSISLPFTPNNTSEIIYPGREALNGTALLGTLSAGASSVSVVTAANAYPGGNSTRITISGSYPINTN